MASDKFDFVVATALIQSVEAAASALEVENQSLEQRFGKLREGFKDIRGKLVLKGRVL